MLAGLAAAALTATGLRRFEVTGASMVPALRPGDRVLIVRSRKLTPGQVVVVGDPRRPGFLMIKRVEAVEGETVTVRGDNAGASTDSRTFGAVPRSGVAGHAVYRYHPPERRGPVR